MRIWFAANVDALYFQIQNEVIAESIEFTDSVYVDVDTNGRVIGIEFALASEFFSILALNVG